MKTAQTTIQLFLLKSILSIRMLRARNRAWTKILLRALRYWRIIEFPYVLSKLPKNGHLDVLDISSPKILAFHIARSYGHRVTATDLWEEEVKLWRQALQTIRNPHINWSNLTLAVEDAKQLSYADASFDFVYSISVIEHIDELGDGEALKEMSRILRKGGLAVVTVPFDHEGYDVFKNEDVYFKRFKDKPVFYERWYNRNQLDERLIKPSKLELIDLSLAIEKYLPLQKDRLKRFYTAEPATLANLWSMVEPLVGLINLRPVQDLSKKEGIALLTLRKP